MERAGLSIGSEAPESNALSVTDARRIWLAKPRLVTVASVSSELLAMSKSGTAPSAPPSSLPGEEVEEGEVEVEEVEVEVKVEAAAADFKSSAMPASSAIAPNMDCCWSFAVRFHELMSEAFTVPSNALSPRDDRRRCSIVSHGDGESGPMSESAAAVVWVDPRAGIMDIMLFCGCVKIRVFVSKCRWFLF